MQGEGYTVQVWGPLLAYTTLPPSPKPFWGQEHIPRDP